MTQGNSHRNFNEVSNALLAPSKEIKEGKKIACLLNISHNGKKGGA
jgi:hypothetical protein